MTAAAITLHHGDVIDVLNRLPERSVHCVVTSPPYLALRSYAGIEGRMWGGDPNCPHEWASRSTKASHYEGVTRWQHIAAEAQQQGAKVRDVIPSAWGHPEVPQGFFCALCGAWKGALGLEPTLDLFVQHTVEWARAVRRVLRDDGTFWLNIGDSYSGSGVNDGSVNAGISKAGARGQSAELAGAGGRTGHWHQEQGIPALNAMMVPERVALALQADGWIVRSRIVWEKPAPMPESIQEWRWEQCRVKVGKGGTLRRGTTELKFHNNHHDDRGLAEWADCPGCPKCTPNGGLVFRRGNWRPTTSYEHIYQLIKQPGAYFDGTAVREAQSEGTHERFGKNPTPTGGRNLRDVWRIGPRPFSAASLIKRMEALGMAVDPELRGIDHYATYPPAIPERCIKAGTPEGGVCATCGTPWARVVSKGEAREHPDRVGRKERNHADYDGTEWSKRASGLGLVQDAVTHGWRSVCGHPGEPVPATVLDPFVGSGTTCIAAHRLGRNSIGIDGSAVYLKLAEARIAVETMPVKEKRQRAAMIRVQQATHPAQLALVAV